MIFSQGFGKKNKNNPDFKWLRYSRDTPPPPSCLCSISCSEFRGGSCRLAPLLAAAALLGAPAQLHGTPVGGCGRDQHGAADPPQLRGEPAETVLLVGHRLLLHYLPSFRHLLEHLCVWAVGGADTTSSLMKAPFPGLCRSSSTSILTPTLIQTKAQLHFPFPTKLDPKEMIWSHSTLTIDQESFFTDTLQIKEHMSLLLKRDYSSNKYRWQFLRSILRGIISFYVSVEISSTSALTFKWAFSHCALLWQAFCKAVCRVVSFVCVSHMLRRSRRMPLV